MLDIGILSAERPAVGQTMDEEHGVAQDVAQGLAARVAALRQRLEQLGLSPVRECPDAVPSLHRIQEIHQQLTHLKSENRQLEAAVATLPAAPAAPHLPSRLPSPSPRPLTYRARRLLLQGRDLLGRLTHLADHAESPTVPEELTDAYRQTLAMTEVAVRSLHGLAGDAGGQLRTCEGVGAILGVIAERISALQSALDRRRKDTDRVHRLAEQLKAVVSGLPADRKALDALAEELVQEREAGFPLRFCRADDARDAAAWAAVHGLNTAQVAARLEPNRLEPVLAALVHDAGMAALPTESFLNPDALSDDQRRVIETHVARGAEAIERFAAAEDWLMDAVRGHHERLDGTGYPRGLKGNDIPKPARLLAVCDVYAALANPRPHRVALAPRTALTDTLLEAEKGRLDSSLAEGLLELSFYPVGTLVELADGQVGVVAATNPLRGGPATPARPIIHLLADAEGRPSPWPTHVNLAQTSGRHIVRSLNPEESRTVLGSKHWEVM